VVKYDAAEMILSIIYYSGGAYSPEEISEIMETIALYQQGDSTDKKSSTDLRIVPINTGESYD
jgi:hypothetical protein